MLKEEKQKLSEVASCCGLSVGEDSTMQAVANFEK